MLKRLFKAIPAPLKGAIYATRDTARLMKAEAAVARFPAVSERRAHGLPGELVVSVTSYPARFSVLAKTLKGLLDQTVIADQTILWLAEGDVPPKDVVALCEFGLQIRTCEDIRSYKKIIPALREWPEAYICIADDDTYYPPRWLETLVRGAGEKVISCRRAHRPRRDGAVLAPYKTWEWSVVTSGEVADLFPTGCGGVLYPPRSLDPMVMDRDQFERLCPNADDVWLYMMARRAGSMYRQVGGGFSNVVWGGSQEESLLSFNVNGGNDDQIKAVEAYLRGDLPANTVWNS
jgi:hypothetical protein